MLFWGLKRNLQEKWEEDLYHKYKKEILLQSEYLVAQEAIIWQLEQQHISCTTSFWYSKI